MATETVRCFIAVELPEDVQRALARLQQGLQARLGRTQGPAVRWVAPAGIHLTLKFLGSVPTDQLAEIDQSLRLAIDGVPRCMVIVSGLGMFPNQSRPRVIWVGVGGDVAALAELQRRVELATVSMGFPSDQRAFSPHLTLARIREELGAAERRAVGACIAGERFDSRLVVPVREVSLMRSELSHAGAKYSRLAAVALAEQG